MSICLSKNKIESFRGNVVPLYINFDAIRRGEFEKADIIWSVEGDCVGLRSFSGEREMNFNNGVLLTLNNVGEAKVTAKYAGEEYVCNVTVREELKADPDGEMNYYLADMHDHTMLTHNAEKCIERESEFQIDYIDFLKEENLMDASVVSDHAGVINDTDFFRGFVADEISEPKDVIILPGAESEVGHIEYDRLGIKHRMSGEIVTLNAAGYIDTRTWQEFEDTFKTSPEPVCIFAHPIVSGSSTPGIWDFDFRNRNTPEMLRIMRGVELGTGKDEDECLIYEYAYSDALDAGFRVSTTCSSDSHGPVWGYHKIPGKTVIKAPEKSKEAFIDALRNNRFYATESGNVKLDYKVNGKTAPCVIEDTSKYKFHVDLGYFKEDRSTEIVSCRVISDGGKTVLWLKDIKESFFDFEIESDTARYFYLRLSDSEGRRTWSMPVWTGREFDVRRAPTGLTVIDSKDFEARDLIGGTDATLAVDGDPYHFWIGEKNKASVLIDMKEKKEICALGFYQRILERVSKKIVPIWNSFDYTPGFPVEYEVYTSEDGESFTMRAEGNFRAIGSEEMVLFERHSARYVRFDVKETVGTYAGFKKYENGPVTIGNIALFE